MRRKRRIRRLTAKQVGAFVFYANEIRYMGAAEMRLGFRDKDDKEVAYVEVWDDVKDHGTIIRTFRGQMYFLPYGAREAKPYRMSLAKLKYLKSRLA